MRDIPSDLLPYAPNEKGAAFVENEGVHVHDTDLEKKVHLPIVNG